MERYDNMSDFSQLVAPLVRQMFIMQMARSKRWSRDARLTHAIKWREALHEALDAVNAFIAEERRRPDE